MLDHPFRTMRELIDARKPILHMLAADAALTEASRLMSAHAVDGLVVVGTDGLVGVLSARNFASLPTRFPDAALCQLRVADAMDATTIHADLATTVAEALAMLPEFGLDHLPVVAGGRVVDLLSRSALLAELVRHHAEVIRDIRLQWKIMHLQGTYSC